MRKYSAKKQKRFEKIRTFFYIKTGLVNYSAISTSAPANC